MNMGVLLYTLHCNISCSHCSVYSGPGRTEKMSLDRATDLIDGFSELPEIEYIDVSGGEVSLYLDEILQLARQVKQNGRQMRLTTNGYWARTVDRATSFLQQMKEAGISDVGLSIDQWHLEHLPVEVGSNYVAACRLVRMQPLISCVLPVDEAEYSSGGAPIELRELLERCGLEKERATDMKAWYQYRDSLDGAQREAFIEESLSVRLLVNWQPLTRQGRAKTMSGNIPARKLEETPARRCTAAGVAPTIDHEGRLFPCCSPWVNYPDHAFGMVDSSSLSDALDSMASSSLTRVLRHYGPKALIEGLARRGDTINKDFSGICSLCGMLLDRLSLSELIALGDEVLLHLEQGESVEF